MYLRRLSIPLLLTLYYSTSLYVGYQEEGSGEPTPVIGTIRITNIGPEATVEKLGELFGSIGKIKVKCSYPTFELGQQSHAGPHDWFTPLLLLFSYRLIRELTNPK